MDLLVLLLLLLLLLLLPFLLTKWKPNLFRIPHVNNTMDNGSSNLRLVWSASLAWRQASHPWTKRSRVEVILAMDPFGHLRLSSSEVREMRSAMMFLGILLSPLERTCLQERRE